MANVAFVSLFDEWCLGLRGMSSILKNKGHKVSITYFRDMNSLNDSEGLEDPNGYHNSPGSVHSRDVEALLRHIRALEPTLLGFSFMSTFYGLACFLTERIKQEFPHLPIVWGGPDPTVNPDLGIRVADYICQGEGEEAVVDLVEAIAAGTSTRSIPNIWIKTGETFISNAPRPTQKDLDVYPFSDFDRRGKWHLHSGLVEEGVYQAGSHLNTNYPTLTSRGCPFSCSFCCNSNYRELYGSTNYVRRHSVDYVIRDLKYRIATYPNLKFVEFYDDVFTFKSSWLQEFAARYRTEIGIPFFAYTHPSMCKNEDLEALHQAGWVTTVMGVQSGSQHVLKMYDRRTARHRLIETAHLLHRIGVQLVIDLIGNNPMETEEDMRETFEVLLEFPLDFTLHEVNPLALYRNFEITRLAMEQGLIGKMLEGCNGALAQEKVAYKFWNAMWTLTQFGSIPRETLRAMADDPYLYEHPEVIEGLVQGFRKTTYLPGTLVRKDVRLQQLQDERQSLEGSRAFRWATQFRKAKNYVLSHLTTHNGDTHPSSVCTPPTAQNN